MSDQKIEVQISADVKDMLHGMQQAKESVETAAAGMRGDLEALVQSFEALGPAALAVGAVGLALEGLKMAVEYVNESIEKTQEMAESRRRRTRRTTTRPRKRRPSSFPTWPERMLMSRNGPALMP